MRIGCWAHVRSYFEKARKAGEEPADQMLSWIGKIFTVERFAKQGRDGKPLSDAELVALGRTQSVPIVAAIRAWIDLAQLAPPSLPRGPLMRGVANAHNQWPTLVRFLDDGRIREISNQGCERALRNLVVGRNHWQ